MRDESRIQSGIDYLNGEIENVAEMEDDSPRSIVLAILQAKRGGLLTVQQSPRGEHWETKDQLYNELEKDLEFGEFLQVQSMINALEWAHEERDTL